mgnify:CR=1 FL=1
MEVMFGSADKVNSKVEYNKPINESRKIIVDVNLDKVRALYLHNGKWLEMIGNGGRQAFDLKRNQLELHLMELWATKKV